MPLDCVLDGNVPCKHEIGIQNSQLELGRKHEVGIQNSQLEQVKSEMKTNNKAG